MSNDALLLRTVEETDPIDNERGPTYRFKEETGTIDNKRGVTYRVQVVGGGGGATIDPLNVTPSTSAQTITASGGVDGYSPISVAAVDASIDANITAGNIKKDVQILGVTGSYEGTAPTGTMYIISNGTYNVADKAIANVQVPTTAPARYIEYTVDNTYTLAPSDVGAVMSFAGIKRISPFCLVNAYTYNQGVPTNLDLSDIEHVETYGMFHTFQYSNVASVDFSSLQQVDTKALESALANCLNLRTVVFNNLTTLTGNSINAGFYSTFSGCQNIQITLGGLTTLVGYAFPYAFGHTTNAVVYFPSLTTASIHANGLRNSCFEATNITLHFPSNVQATIETLSGYSTTAPFSATSGTVLFDLPATE